MLKIVKGKYGSYERPCIYINEGQGLDTQVAYFGGMNEYGREVIKQILEKIEYCLKNNIEVEIEGFIKERKE